jgi:hypothetical protein
MANNKLQIIPANALEILKLLDQLIVYINTGSLNTLYTKWNDSAAAISELETLYNKIERNEYSALIELKILFAPTGSLQDLSIDNGWADEFLVLAEQFDKLIGD